MPLANSDNFNSSFSIWMPFTSCLIAVARTYNSVVNKGGKSGFLILFLTLEVKFKVFIIEYDVD